MSTFKKFYKIKLKKILLLLSNEAKGSVKPLDVGACFAPLSNTDDQSALNPLLLVFIDVELVENGSKTAG